MKSNKGGIMSFIFIIILLVLLGSALYLLYLNWPSDPRELIFIDDFGEQIDIDGADSQEAGNFSKSMQFYDNMRYKDKRISYKIEEICDSKKTSETERALEILEQETVLDFYPVTGEAELTIFCSSVDPEIESDTEGYFVAGEGGPTEVIDSTAYGVILSGKVSFFRDEKCENPQIALHEILHALGFDHNNNPNSILFPTLDCGQEIDEFIIEDINNLYAVKSAADLKIADIDATKAGRYLDFNIEVINQGLQDADSVSLKIFADDDFVKEFDLEEIEIGTRKFLEVTNLKVSRSAERIVFIVDPDDRIDEIFENNNKADLK